MLAGQMERLVMHLLPHGRRSGREWLVGDLSGAPGKSLSVCIAGPKVGAWADFSTGAKGGPVDLWMGVRGLKFPAAKAEALAWLGLPGSACVTAASETRAANRIAMPERMDDASIARAVRAAERLALDAHLCSRIAAARGWKVETVRGLALDCSLGWEEGKLTFHYETGIKGRWKDAQGQRVIRFLTGRAGDLWRAWMLWERVCTVYVTEGETDAIALIDSGAERDLGALVVALPSASTIPADIAAKLAGKNVIVCTDNDAAGHAARAKLVEALKDSVGTLKTLNWRNAA